MWTWNKNCMDVSSNSIFSPKESNSSRADLFPVRCSAFPAERRAARAACVPPGLSLLLGYSGRWGSVWKDGEKGWNFPHEEVKANFTLPVRQPKCYAWFVFPEVPSAEAGGREGTENPGKWGPKSIITEKASVQALSRAINCGELRSCHPALTIFQPHAEEPPALIPRCLGIRCLDASHPAQIKCVHRARTALNKEHRLVSSASRLYGDLGDTSGPLAGYIPLPRRANGAVNPQLTSSFVRSAIRGGSFALRRIWRTVQRWRPLLEPCGDLLPPCTCLSRGCPLLQPPSGQDTTSSLHRGTQGSPRAPLAVAIRQITTLYSVLLQFNTFQKKQIGCITLGKALGRVK